MRPLSKFVIPVIISVSCFFNIVVVNQILADSSSLDKPDPGYKTFHQRVETGVTNPITGYHISWKEGFHLESPKKKLKFKIGGKLVVDGGEIDADDELQGAFPDLDGSEIDFRNLSADIFGTLYDSVEGRFEIDFANIADVKDNWIRFLKIPYLKHVKIGHMKEPFSLEEQTGLSSITFMERALPVKAFSPGRNIGIRYDHPGSDRILNGSAGIYLNTGSFGTIGEASNQLSNANGFNITGRIFGHPVFEGNDEKILHLGLSYTHGFRNEEDIRFRARPESRLTDDRLVDTGEFQADGYDKIGTELALVLGSLSFQGEYFYTSTDAPSKSDPDFWGAYAYLSWFINGEHRKYIRSRGTFSFGEQYYRFRPRKGNWGALELGLRYSYLDLNDAEIKGGKEKNFTAGLNWYHKRNIRLMFNYIHANVKDRASPLIENGRADIFQLRFQIIY